MVLINIRRRFFAEDDLAQRIHDKQRIQLIGRSSITEVWHDNEQVEGVERKFPESSYINPSLQNSQERIARWMGKEHSRPPEITEIPDQSFRVIMEHDILKYIDNHRDELDKGVAYHVEKMSGELSISQKRIISIMRDLDLIVE